MNSSPHFQFFCFLAQSTLLMEYLLTFACDSFKWKLITCDKESNMWYPSREYYEIDTKFEAHYIIW